MLGATTKQAPTSGPPAAGALTCPQLPANGPEPSEDLKIGMAAGGDDASLDAP
jgi:hypothetical protein